MRVDPFDATNSPLIASASQMRLPAFQARTASASAPALATGTPARMLIRAGRDP